MATNIANIASVVFPMIASTDARQKHVTLAILNNDCIEKCI